MTAEIAILNRHGVALAADSAVTIGDSKIYNTVNKLFTLSKFHPVGVMIYGNAEYMTIPWETIIKLYREERGNKSLPTVRAYALDFVKFLVRWFSIDPTDERRRILQIWSTYFEDMNRTLRHRLLRQVAATKKTLQQQEVTKIFSDLIKEETAKLKKQKTLPQYRSIRSNSLHQRFEVEFNKSKDAYFLGRHLTPGIVSLLREYAGLLLVKSEFRLAVSGLVIAGFGDDEIFPAMQCLRCAGKVLGHLKIIGHAYSEVTSDEQESVYIRPFAQGEMVYRFMEGIDQTYSNYLRDAIDHLMNRLSKDLIMKYSPGSDATKLRRVSGVQKTVQKMITEFERNATQLRYGYFVKPVLDIVSVLPKEELAELAGALVNITSLKRKISPDAETVGGPIDVAVISKGDGFIWIRRKHYFRPEINPSFVQKYLEQS